MKLSDFRNIPFNVSLLDSVFPANKALVAKANRLEQSGDIIRLKRGLYVVSPRISGKKISNFLLANHLYGPSYVSMQSALRFYGLIPERVYEITSMTTALSKSFTNKIAFFSYTHCPDEYFSLGVKSLKENGIYYLIATPEKALCDLMIYTPGLNLRYLKEIGSYLEDDIRFDISELSNFNLDLLRDIRDKGMKKQMITQLIKFIEDERNV
ncbi:MAG: hypothetical protein J1E63_02260 [Muribaculaceae bacterium]|nr:hypothetical protein [Muribaculaceae bacterium]